MGSSALVDSSIDLVTMLTTCGRSTCSFCEAKSVTAMKASLKSRRRMDDFLMSPEPTSSMRSIRKRSSMPQKPGDVASLARKNWGMCRRAVCSCIMS